MSRANVPSFEEWLRMPRAPELQPVEFTYGPLGGSGTRDWADIPRTPILPANAAIKSDDPRLCKCCARCTELKLIKGDRMRWDLQLFVNERGEKFIMGRTPEECAPRMLRGPPKTFAELRKIPQSCRDRCTIARHREEQTEEERRALETDWVRWRAYHAALFAKLLDETVTLSSLFE